MPQMIWISINLLSLLLIVQTAPITFSPNAEQHLHSQNPEELGEKYQGDMVLPPTMGTARGLVIEPVSNRWPDGIVPYEFAANITPTNVALIVNMMREMETLTAVNGTQCIQFREKNPSDLYFITIYNGTGCFAPVGNWGTYPGIRGVSLLDSPTLTCMISGIIQHELTHVLGLYHEQSRPDRDLYVGINWNNIQNGQAYNFEKYNESEVDTLGTNYDYGSVMHYGPTAFAIDSSIPTIYPTYNPSAFIGQRVQLSPVDILEIQRYYGCVPTPSLTDTTETMMTTANMVVTTVEIDTGPDFISTPPLSIRRNTAVCSTVMQSSVILFLVFLLQLLSFF